METLSVLFLSWRDLRNPDAGGAEVFTHEVGRRWASLGHDVTLVTSAFSDSPREETVDGVRVIRRGNPITVYHHAKNIFLGRFAGKVDVAIDEVNTRPFLASGYVDGSTRLFALIYQLAREFWSYETPFPISWLGRYWLEDRWLRRYRSVPTFTISESTRDDLIRLDFRDVTVVPPGVSLVPLERLPEKDDVPTLVYVARLKRAKFPDHALRVFALVKRRLPSAQLWVIGDGYMRASIERSAPDGTTFFGRIPDEAKAALLRRAHILLAPAVREGWSLAVLEANACGTPAIGYRVPGLQDSIRHEETGFLVPFGNVDELANHAVALLEEPSRRIELAANALRWAGEFNWDRTATRLLDCLQGRVGLGVT